MMTLDIMWARYRITSGKLEGEHTAYYQYPFMSASELFENTLKAGGLKYRPGEKWAYNNIAYFLAGVAVERVSGKHLRDFAEERIFEPLGLKDTFFQTQNYVPVKGRADGYFRMKDGRFIEWPTDLNWIGDGGIFTTVEDLAKWDRNFYDNRLGGGQALIDEYIRPNTDIEYPEWEKHPGEAGAAMGTYTSITDFGPVVQHGGSWVGFPDLFHASHGIRIRCLHAVQYQGSVCEDA